LHVVLAEPADDDEEEQAIEIARHKRRTLIDPSLLRSFL
jgi:hypothetical protein